VIFGEGPETARIVVIGEHPGEEENRVGRPWIGGVGVYTFKKLFDLINVDREELFMTNAVMCYPGKDKEPSKSDLQTCREWLLKILYAIDPVLVIAMGNDAVESLTGQKVSITHEYGRIILMDIPGRITSYKLPVAVMANPAFLRRDNDVAENSHYHWQLWALQNVVELADTVANAWYGDAMRQRGTVKFDKPQRLRNIPRLEPDSGVLGSFD
jgi:uracil-DNA glycosylase family 4